MKKFVNPFDTGGAPIFSDDLLLLQDNSAETFKSQFSVAFDGCIEGRVISGCAITDEGATFAIADGQVFVDGDFYNVTAETGLTKPSYIHAEASPTTLEQRIFRDGSSKDILSTKEAVISTAPPVSGQRVSICRPIAVHNVWENFVTTGGGFINSWVEDSNRPLEFKKNLDGTVSWRGILDGGASASDGVIQTAILSNWIDLAIPIGASLRIFNSVAIGHTTDVVFGMNAIINPVASLTLMSIQSGAGVADIKVDFTYHQAE